MQLIWIFTIRKVKVVMSVIQLLLNTEDMLAVYFFWGGSVLVISKLIGGGLFLLWKSKQHFLTVALLQVRAVFCFCGPKYLFLSRFTLTCDSFPPLNYVPALTASFMKLLFWHYYYFYRAVYCILPSPISLLNFTVDVLSWLSSSGKLLFLLCT